MSPVVATVIFAVAAYLIGSISFAVVVSRAMGLADPRTYGSGNPGATNVLRSGNKKAAILTLLGDAAKGWLAVWLAQWLAARFGVDETGIALVVIAVFLGHLFPVFHRFEGGKGVATAAGILLALNVWLGLATLATWLIIAVFFRYSSLAALVSAVFAPFFYVLMNGFDWIAGAVALMAVLLIARHRANIAKLLAGKESRIGEKKKRPNSAARRAPNARADVLRAAAPCAAGSTAERQTCPDSRTAGNRRQAQRADFEQVTRAPRATGAAIAAATSPLFSRNAAAASARGLRPRPQVLPDQTVRADAAAGIAAPAARRCRGWPACCAARCRWPRRTRVIEYRIAHGAGKPRIRQSRDQPVRERHAVLHRPCGDDVATGDNRLCGHHLQAGDIALHPPGNQPHDGQALAGRQHVGQHRHPREGRCHAAACRRACRCISARATSSRLRSTIRAGGGCASYLR